MTRPPYAENERGLRVEHDLSGTTVELTCERGRSELQLIGLAILLTLMGCGLVVALLPADVVGFALWLGPLAGMLLPLWLRLLRVRVEVRARSMVVTSTRFGHQIRTELDYTNVRRVTLEKAWWGPVLDVWTVAGDRVRIPYGTTEDLGALQEQIRARLPETPSQTPLRAPQALERLKQGVQVPDAGPRLSNREQSR